MENKFLFSPLPNTFNNLSVICDPDFSQRSVVEPLTYNVLWDIWDQWDI